MKLSLNWLKQYIKFSSDPKSLADKLTMIGLEIEEIVSKGDDFTHVKVGKVLQVEKHPNADKLSICQVDIGSETLSIVCGAPNVAEDQYVPVAIIGAILPGGFEIKPVKLRGVESFGMICSTRELGLDEDHSGIMVLTENDYSIGDDFSTNQKTDNIFEVNVTPNRPDCLSYLGIAREVSVFENNPVVYPNIRIIESKLPASDTISIKIEDPDACPRYVGRTIQNVKIGPSPDWLKASLESIGIRSINNVVDITNFVLMETGHPLHAFDYNQISDQKIIIRKAEADEIFTTLDEVDRKLTTDDLLICDGKRPVALAGIMGGQNSEVTHDTRHIFLESAYFDPMTIRKTAKRLGMSTEASQRFERGADPENTVLAIDRAAQLIAELAAGEVCVGHIDAYPKTIKPKEITFRYSRIKTVLGLQIPKDQVLNIFQKLKFDTKETDPWIVTVPTFRPDLIHEIDLIEEIVRHYGYDKIQPSLYASIGLNQNSNTRYRFIEKCRDIWVGLGFMDTLSNSLVSEKHVKVIKADSDIISVQNPLSPDTGFLRNHLIPSLLDVLQWNLNRQQSDVRLFEMGRTYTKSEETQRIAGLMIGNERLVKYWGSPSKPVDYYHLKGIIFAFLQKLNIGAVTMETLNHPLFDDNQAQQISHNNRVIGVLGLLDQQTALLWDVDFPVYAFDFSIDQLMSGSPKIVKYQPVSKFPSVKRDLAILVEKEIKASQIVTLIQKQSGEYLKSIDIFDLYEGEQIPENKKSLAFSLTFISHQRTLTDSDIDPNMERLIQLLEKKFSATLRS